MREGTEAGTADNIRPFNQWRRSLPPAKPWATVMAHPPHNGIKHYIRWGLCKGHVAPGDQVSQLMGRRVPLVLRSVGPAPVSEFRLVGTTAVAELGDSERPNAWQTHLVEDEYFGVTLV